MSFEVLHDETLQKEFVQCDICNKALVLKTGRSLDILARHRKTGACTRAAESRRRNDIQTFHLKNDDTLPPFPGELRVTTHIRSEEEKKTGIRQEQTDLWREDNDVPDSMSILELMQDQEIAQQEEGREGRRRAASNISSILLGANLRQRKDYRRRLIVHTVNQYR